jgi:hypothetical protein
VVAAADDVVVVVAEVADALEDVVALDVDPVDESSLEQPAAINVRAASPTIDIRFSCIGKSIALPGVFRCGFVR